MNTIFFKEKGKISREDVNKFVKEEYEKYRPIQDKLYKSIIIVYFILLLKNYYSFSIILFMIEFL